MAASHNRYEGDILAPQMRKVKDLIEKTQKEFKEELDEIERNIKLMIDNPEKNNSQLAQLQKNQEELFTAYKSITSPSSGKIYVRTFSTAIERLKFALGENPGYQTTSGTNNKEYLEEVINRTRKYHPNNERLIVFTRKIEDIVNEQPKNTFIRDGIAQILANINVNKDKGVYKPSGAGRIISNCAETIRNSVIPMLLGALKAADPKAKLDELYTIVAKKANEKKGNLPQHDVYRNLTNIISAIKDGKSTEEIQNLINTSFPTLESKPQYAVVTALGAGAGPEAGAAAGAGANPEVESTRHGPGPRRT